MLVTSIFSFFHNVFYASDNKFLYYSHLYFEVCESFQSGLFKSCVVKKTCSRIKLKNIWDSALRSGLLKTYLTLYHTIPTFNDPEKEALWKHWGKRRKHWYPAFYLFPQCFLLCPTQSSIFVLHLSCDLPLLSIWTGLRLCRVVKSIKEKMLGTSNFSFSKNISTLWKTFFLSFHPHLNCRMQLFFEFGLVFKFLFFCKQLTFWS